ncbi:MAG: 4-hydroxy-tetrahydrodipicolinate synthase [Oscillospiraceae bacterium]
MSKNTTMRGITAPVLTPFHKDGTVNYDEYKKIIRYITENGVHGIFICGTTGEFVNLTIQERKQLLSAAVQSAKPGTNILFNATAMNIWDTKELINWATECGVSAVSFTAPYYHRYDEKSLISYFQKTAQLAGDKAVYLYNMVSMTNNPITPSVLKAVVESCPNVCGIKDSSMDFMVLLNYQCAVEKNDFEIITGNDAQVLTALQADAAGGVIAAASVFPALCAEIWDKFQNGDLQGARRAQTTVLKLRELFRSVMPVMAHKKALELQGFNMGPARFPFRNLTQEESKKVEFTLHSLGLL